MWDDWWRGSVVYEIYPRSFQDGDGDGIGDLAGIVRRLPQVAALGVDAIWIAPFYRSPMKDFGYDVSDYCAVDPTFGTLADFDRVVAEAHALGLKVLIDQVWCHTSDRHPWFLESCADPAGRRGDWYVWADAKADGSPPNNWLSVFGGPAWRWDPRRRQYFLHHFLASQPKLNLRNPDVLDALAGVGEFWLDRGVDGFRLDAVDFMLHDPELRDNPPRPPADGQMPVKPFGLQTHLYDMAHPDTLAVTRRIRALMDRYPGTTTIAEVSSEFDALHRASDYTGGDGDRLHMAYTLRLTRGAFDAGHLRTVIAEVEDRFADGGWLCWAFSNHDVERVASRWGDGSAACAKMMLALLLSLRGGICLFQGEELGLPEAELPYEALRDPYGINFFPQFKGRDGCRTPIPWEAGAPNGGFSTAPPWLPLPREHLPLAVDAQEADAHSVLYAARALLRWRRSQPALRDGKLRLLASDGDVLAFERGSGDAAILCAFNIAPLPGALPLAEDWALLDGYGLSVPARRAGTVQLPPYGFLFAGRVGN